MQEKIEMGERVRSFIIEAKKSGRWEKIDQGTCIGHKYIKLTENITNVRDLSLRITSSLGEPQIENFSVY